MFNSSDIPTGERRMTEVVAREEEEVGLSFEGFREGHFEGSITTYQKHNRTAREGSGQLFSERARERGRKGGRKRQRNKGGRNEPFVKREHFSLQTRDGSFLDDFVSC